MVNIECSVGMGNEAGGSSSLADAGFVIEVHMFRLPAGST